MVDYGLSRRYPETWAAMERLVDSGKARSIGNYTLRSVLSSTSSVANFILQGLSNFNMLKTKRILKEARIIPAVNQVEHHPYDFPHRTRHITIDVSSRFFPQTELLSLCRSNGIVLVAHQPLGGRPVRVVRANPHEPFPTEHPQVRLPVHCYF